MIEIFKSLVELFSIDRLVHPLLNVFDVLYSSGICSRLDNESHELFYKSLVVLLTRTRDLKKLMPGIKNLCWIVNHCDDDKELRNKSLMKVCGYLMHSFPKIRRFTAQELYLVVSSGDYEEGVEERLMQVDWDMSVEELKYEVEGMMKMMSL